MHTSWDILVIEINVHKTLRKEAVVILVVVVYLRTQDTQKGSCGYFGGSG